MARRFVDKLLEVAPPDELIGSRLVRIRGASRGGGVRVDGGSNGFRERTVSLTDIAWVLVADQGDRADVPDEAEVNAVRYLPGTTRRSTRWVDTGIALELLAWAKANAGWRTGPTTA